MTIAPETEGMILGIAGGIVVIAGFFIFMGVVHNVVNPGEPFLLGSCRTFKKTICI